LRQKEPAPTPGEFDFRAPEDPVPAFIASISFVDRHLNRRAAALLVKAVYRTRVTPNQLTWVSAVMGWVSGALFALGEPTAFVLAGLAAQLSSIIDGADGMLARARGQCSPFGSHLDLFLDRVIDFSIFAGIALGPAAISSRRPCSPWGCWRRASTSCRSSSST
jgi:hypothetical protein